MFSNHVFLDEHSAPLEKINVKYKYKIATHDFLIKSFFMILLSFL